MKLVLAVVLFCCACGPASELELAAGDVVVEETPDAGYDWAAEKALIQERDLRPCGKLSDPSSCPKP